MATIQSLPVEIILPIVRQVYPDKLNKFIPYPKELWDISTVSASFRWAAQILLRERHKDIGFSEASRAVRWLAGRNSAYEVKRLEIGGGCRDGLTAALASQVIAACSPTLEALDIEIQGGGDICFDGIFENLRTLEFYDDFSSASAPPLNPIGVFVFPALQRLYIYDSPLSVTSRLLAAASTALVTAVLPIFGSGSEDDFANAFRHVADGITSLDLDFDDTPRTSSLYSLLKDCNAVHELDVRIAALPMLYDVLSHLPNPTVTSLVHSADTESFVLSSPDVLGTFKEIIALPNLKHLDRLDISWEAVTMLDDSGLSVRNRGGDEERQFREYLGAGVVNGSGDRVVIHDVNWAFK